ncbi:FecR family protein [Sphingobacterium faecale]|uniref:FecR domain-containing protein n=1 Tax=Sphingobacterium faecale TaxID=2803775 RepID=A0ABS1RA07_9SPHI|nr:FecR domain-containing protein [Sphingobacterium faecale]MBL1411537.1 FecR domain-containing protein [Sphingobacterium faecale]
MENKENLKVLFERYLKGDYSREDVDELLAYFGMPHSEQELQALIEEAMQEEIDLRPFDQQIKQVDEVTFDHLQAYIAPSKVRYWPLAGIAASILIVLGFGWAIYQYTHKVIDNDKITTILGTDDIAPGTDRATLTFDNEETFVLDGKEKGIDNQDGEVRYRGGELLTRTVRPVQLILKTPVGGQYQVTLPDGTKVWLNAASEIRYPSAFEEATRQISVKGEVYLEVAKDATRPFVVETEGQHLEVLGTHFNINAYGDKGMIWTTLSEGRVRVVQSATGREVVLKPGQQAQNQLTGGIKVNEVDLDQVLAWKEGMYILRNEEIGLFSKQIERWYDVQIEMGPYAGRKVSAIVPRSAKLSAVLEAITLETGIHFNVEGRRVTAVGK